LRRQWQFSLVDLAWSIIMLEICFQFTGFLPPRADNAHTGHNGSKALHYAPCIPGYYFARASR
ncbi:hypothetical protein, partial [Klebsiella pneumoniae]|uniref:hypothetical protein n=1 Tax=Klebsiella pneumoniae TaxID=573 RepID=UPI001D0EE061